jgi:sugar lactone lactonase YvrE
MKNIVLLLACAVWTLHATAQNDQTLSHPESLRSDGHFLYATNLGKTGDPAAKDGDGFISKLSLDGKMITPNITKEVLNAPKGTAIIKGVLYVADLDRIVGIDLASGKKAAEISLSATHTKFANDLTVKDDHTLFVSLMDVGKVVEVNLSNGQTTPVVDLKGANGLHYDQAGKRLYTCNFLFENVQGGEIGVVSWQAQKPVYERIGDIHGGFDGLEQLDEHTLVVSDWVALDHPAGIVEKIDLRSKTATKLEMPVIAGPADFYLDAKKKRLFIPVMLESKIMIQSL